MTATMRKDLSIKVLFEGSGHDEWNNGSAFKEDVKETKTSIEDKITVVERTKVLAKMLPKK